MGGDNDLQPKAINEDAMWAVGHVEWKAVEDYGFAGENDMVSSEEHKAAVREQKLKWKGTYEAKVERQTTRWGNWLHKHTTDEVELENAKIKKMVRKGIPSSSRRRIWLAELQIERKLRENSGLYASLVDQGRRSSDEIVNVIKKDLNRTFPNHPLFNSEKGIRQLQNVLLAYSVRNPVIGYCQSMNYIAGILLIFMREEEAFWTFTEIIENILPKDFYSTSLLGAHVDLSVLKTLLSEKFRKLSAHFVKHNVDISVMCMSWFLCLFVNTLPVETCLRIWDVLFLERDKILFRAALALFKLHESELLACEDAGALYNKLNKMGNDCFDCDTFMKTAFYRIGTLKRTHIDELRERARIHIQALHDEREKKRAEYRTAPKP